MATNKLPHFIEIDHEGRDIRIDRPAGTCICGCGQPTAEDSRFRQGHDQRYRGVLLHAFRLAYSISVVDGGMLVTCDPQQQALNDGVDMGKIKWVAGTIKQLNKKTAEEKPVSKPAPTPDGITDLMDALEQSVIAAKAARDARVATKTEPIERPIVGAAHKVKVGRWTYDAVITDTGTRNGRWIAELTYTSKRGEVKTITRTTAELYPEA